VEKRLRAEMERCWARIGAGDGLRVAELRGRAGADQRVGNPAAVDLREVADLVRGADALPILLGQPSTGFGRKRGQGRERFNAALRNSLFAKPDSRNFGGIAPMLFEKPVQRTQRGLIFFGLLVPTNDGTVFEQPVWSGPSVHRR